MVGDNLDERFRRLPPANRSKPQGALFNSGPDIFINLQGAIDKVAYYLNQSHLTIHEIAALEDFDVIHRAGEKADVERNGDRFAIIVNSDDDSEKQRKDFFTHLCFAIIDRQHFR